MIKTIIIMILVMSLFDLGATYLYVSKFAQKFPQLDATKLEANPILRTTMQHFGIQKGMLIGGIIVFVVLFFIVIGLTERWQYFLAGALAMMLIYHFLNFSQLAALKPVP